MICAFSAVVLLAIAVGASAANLPVPTAELRDFEYTSRPAFESYKPATATVSLFNDFILLYGSPLGSEPRKLELFDLLNADVCYSATCPSTTTLYPQPNYVLSLGGLTFAANDIVPSTGVSSVNSDFKVTGIVLHGAGGTPPGEPIAAEGFPVLFTGDDPGGASSYVYFRNADGTYSSTLHVLRNMSGGAQISGVILDPPSFLTLDILGFSDAGPNSFITAPVPEPNTVQLEIAALAFVAGLWWRRRAARGCPDGMN